MPIENKQNGIVRILEQRIADGIYTNSLPKTGDLKEEFDVNLKTLNKAILRLVDRGLVYRKPGKGTFVAKAPEKVEDTLIELLFVGSSEMFIHPFYSDMWRGLLDGIEGAGYKLVLTSLEENEKRGGLKRVCQDTISSAAKILVGTNNAEQLKILKKSKVPILLVGEKTDLPDVVAVYTDIREAVSEAVRYLRKKRIDDIAFIGQTAADGEHLWNLDKFHSYLEEIQRKGGINSDLIINTPSFARFGYSSMKAILDKQIPQAVISAYDHLVPGIYEAIKERNLSIPDDISVIGIDGLDLNLHPKLTSIPVNRYQIGLTAGRQIVAMIRNPRKKYQSTILSTTFDPKSGESVR